MHIETRKTKRIKRHLAKVEQEQVDVKRLIVKAKNKPDALDKLRVHEALLQQQINDYQSQLNAVLAIFEQQAQDARQLYELKQAKQQAERERAEQEALIQAEIARQQQIEEDDIVFIMAMLAAA